MMGEDPPTGGRADRGWGARETENKTNRRPHGGDALPARISHGAGAAP